MIVFIVSEGFFFLMLIIAYLYYNYTPGAGPTAASSLNVGRTALFTICLFASSFTVWRAERGFKRKDRAAMNGWLAVTSCWARFFSPARLQSIGGCFSAA
jgi:heme/copper-type cytochrome/quinol oxidase subunit 3